MAKRTKIVGLRSSTKEKTVGKPYSRGNTKKMLASVAGSEAKGGIEKLVCDIESDEQFFLGYLTLKSLVESAKVSIEVEGDERAQSLADNLIAKFKEALPHACRAIGFGRQVFEKWYAGYDAQTGQNQVGGLEPLPYSLTSMVVAGGEYYGCELKVKTEQENGDKEVTKLTITARASWWFALDPTPEQPQGKSRYLGSPEKVLARRQQLNDSWKIFGGRAANGITVAKAPNEYPSAGLTTKGDVGEVDQYGEPENPITDLVNSLVGAEDGGVIGVSSATDPESKVPLFEVLTQPVQSSADPLKAMQSKEDDAALKSLGIPPKALDNNTGVGSYAQAETFMKPLLSTVEGILSQIVSSYQKQVIDDATAVNFGKTAKLTMVWQPLSEDRTAFVLDIVKGLMASPALSPLVVHGAIDLGKLFEIAGLPAGQDIAAAMEAVRKMSATMQATGQPQIGLPQPGQSQPVVDPNAPDVASTALNGAQITALIAVLQSAADKSLPLASVKPIVKAGFPGISDAMIDAIVKPIYKFDPDPSTPTKQLSLVAGIDEARNALEVEGQPDVFSQSQIAKDLAAKIKARLPELIATVGDDQERGRL